MLGLTPVSAAVGAGGALTVSPTSGSAGSDITVSGTACSEATANVRLESTTGGVTVQDSETVTVVTGSFSTTLTVPDLANTDHTYQVVAFCGPESDAASRYTPVAFTVTPRTLVVTPLSGPPGQVITVTGGECGETTADVVLRDGTGTFVSESRNVPVNNRSFTTTLTVPLTADPEGAYVVIATCGPVGNPLALYEGYSFDVTPGTTPPPARTLTVSPTSGDAGTVINVSGTACTAPTADVFLGVSFGEMGDGVDEKQDVAVSLTGTFSTTLTVPANSDPSGVYSISATCGQTEAPVFTYERQAFDVTGDAPQGPQTGESGYRMVAADGGVFTFGNRTFHGSTGDIVLNRPIVGGATDVSDYDGYWMVASDGGIFTFSAGFYGSLGDRVLASPAVEIEPTPTGLGYFIVLADGTVHAFGDAVHQGDIAGAPLNRPIVGMSVTPSGQGYWLVAGDGGIFNFGDAGFFGSTGNMTLNAPILDIAPAVDNNGYYLLGRDGGVFTFGSAEFKGSTGAMTLNAPVVAMLVSPTGAGYWLAASDGGVFTFGAVPFHGSMGAIRLNSPVLDLIN